jgi:carbon starvation protein CstA
VAPGRIPVTACFLDPRSLKEDQPRDRFPFAFITIACGAISGFHSLVASGTTPKMLAHEPDARMIGYGGMLMESFVGVMAMIAACTLEPGVYFAMNTTPAGLAVVLLVLGVDDDRHAPWPNSRSMV